MNAKKSITMIYIDEIRNLFKESCEKNGETFSEARFKEFLKFLEIDFYHWVKGNIKQFYSTKS